MMRVVADRSRGARARIACVAGMLATALALGVAAESRAAHAIFVDVPGIPGEAIFPPAAGQIEALSYAWNVGQLKAVKLGNAGVCSAAASKPAFSGLCVKKRVDKASPKLFVAAAQGTTFAMVKISLYRTDTSALLARYTLSNAIVSSIQMGGSSGDELPSETVCFNASKSEIAVVTTPPAGGAGETVVGGFDACMNSPL